MADTLGDLKTLIASDLGRSDLTTEIADAITRAIAYYAADRFYFNETVGTFPLIAGQKWYASTDTGWASVADILEIDAVSISLGSTSYPLSARTLSEIERADNSSSTRGDPTDYTFYRQQLRFYPIPQQVRTVTISYVSNLAALSTDGSSNAWTTTADAAGLIRARARWDLFANKIRNYEAAAAARQAELDELSGLTEATAQLIGSGRIVPTQF